MPEPLPQHHWEITVQLPNGDWEYMKTIARVTFQDAVEMALAFAAADSGPLVAIVNIDPAPHGPWPKPPRFDLDVDAPDKVAPVLRAAADAFQASDLELTAAWQDKRAGLVWSYIAGELDSAAARIEKKVANMMGLSQPRK